MGWTEFKKQWVVVGLIFVAACADDRGLREIGTPIEPTESSRTAIAHAAPIDYYEAISIGLGLRASLHETIDDHERVDFTDTRDPIDTWDILEEADQDLSDPTRIVDVYHNQSFPKHGRGNSDYSREHTWPSSYGFPRDVVANVPYTDCHALFLSDGRYNSARNNRAYDVVTSATSRWETAAAEGGPEPALLYREDDVDNLSTAETWQTWHGRRGDVARALLYLDVRYEGGIHRDKNVPEPDLRLTNDLGLLVSDRTQNTSVAFMGRLDVLLRWHVEDPVDDLERRRNAVVAKHQHNRNPFIDYPEWARCIFGDKCVLPWVNEVRPGSDGFVEIAGPGGLSLDDYSLILYSGHDGFVIDAVMLSGVLPDERAAHGTLAFDVTIDEQPVGLALVDDSGVVVEFISMGQPFIAQRGPAQGMRSAPVPEVDARDRSIQRVGTSMTAGQFAWVEHETSRGQLNAAQAFLGEPIVPPSTEVWVSEFHYDNAGADEGEFIEVAGPPGASLQDWSLVLYTGSSSQPYRTYALDALLSSRGVAAFETPGLQNGNSDAIALVDPDGTLVEFISYEGTLVGDEGPADGVMSRDVGIEQTSGTEPGRTIARVGDGSTFVWAHQEGSPGLPNPM